MSTPEGPGNRHVPSSTSESLARHLNPAELLPLEFFDQTLPQSSQWSISALQAWLQTSKPYLDEGSGTVYGGPLGARVLVFAFSRIFQSIARVGSGSRLPEEVRRVTRGDRASWSSTNSISKVRQCVDQVLRDVIKSTSVLSITFPERSAAWEDAVFLAYEEVGQRGDDVGRFTEGNVVSITSGVPAAPGEILDMWRILQERVGRLEEGDESAEAWRIVSQRGTPAGTTARTAVNSIESGRS